MGSSDIPLGVRGWSSKGTVGIKEERLIFRRLGIKHPTTSPSMYPLWTPRGLSLRVNNIIPFFQPWRTTWTPPAPGHKASSASSVTAAITVSEPPPAARGDLCKCPMRREGLDVSRHYMAPATVPSMLKHH
ncbi:hypothetical protein ACLOJK_024215 [Asimina triloba]